MKVKTYCGNKEKYMEYIKNLSFDRKYYKNNEKHWDYQYIDPDGTYINADSEFYSKLALFLNIREEEMRLCPKYIYEFHSEYPGGIWVKEEGANEICFYLRSDQFGFSALRNASNTWEEKYPYAKYLRGASVDDRYLFVATCVCDTRSIGGSFLWPLRMGERCMSVYNMRRGIGSYIEDRVDLTLLEVKHYFDWKNSEYEEKREIDYYPYKDDILYIHEIKENSANMREWLNHFETFDKYIKFFMLEDFVYIDNEEYKIIDITDSKIEETDVLINVLQNNIVKEKVLININDSQKLRQILSNVRNLIIKRSERMERKIGVYC